MTHTASQSIYPRTIGQHQELRRTVNHKFWYNPVSYWTWPILHRDVSCLTRRLWDKRRSFPAFRSFLKTTTILLCLWQSLKSTYIKDALSEAPPGWDIIYLGWCSELCTFEKPVSAHLQTAVAPLCTHSFALSQKGAAKVAAVLKRGGRPNDVDLRLAIMNGELESYKTNEPLFDQIKNLGDTASQQIAAAMGKAQNDTAGLTNSHNLNPQTQLCHPEKGSNFRSVVDNMMESMQGWREKMVMHRASSLQGRKQLKLLMPQSAIQAARDANLLNRVKQLENVNGTKGFREVYADVDRMVEALHWSAAARRLRRDSDPCTVYGEGGTYGGIVGYGISDYGFECSTTTPAPTGTPTRTPTPAPTRSPTNQPTNGGKMGMGKSESDSGNSGMGMGMGMMGMGMMGMGKSGSN